MISTSLSSIITKLFKPGAKNAPEIIVNLENINGDVNIKIPGTNQGQEEDQWHCCVCQSLHSPAEDNQL